MDEADSQRHSPVDIWPDGVPGSLGDADKDRPRLTPFLCESIGADAPARAAVVVCPGGGYCTRAPHEGAPVAEWLVSLGVTAFVLDYRVAPYRHPWPLADALRAIRLVRSRAEARNVDPERVGVLGFSAGGHLAASAATLFDRLDVEEDDLARDFSARPDALVACYPVVTFGERAHEGCLGALLGDSPGSALRELLSLEKSVTAANPPAFIWHTADDAGVPVENSLLLAGALRDAGVDVELHVFRHGRHGLGLAEEEPDVARWTDLCAAWLRAIGFR